MMQDARDILPHLTVDTWMSTSEVRKKMMQEPGWREVAFAFTYDYLCELEDDGLVKRREANWQPFQPYHWQRVS